MRVLKKTGAVVLAMALAVPAIASAPQSDAAAKAPELTFTETQILPDASQTVYIESNKTKIVKTTWKTSDKKVITLSKKKKKTVDIKAVGPGETSAKVTAKVKYKVGKKVKTKKLTCKVNVVWFDIDVAGAMSSSIDGHTILTLYFNQLSENITPYDTVPDEGEVVIAGAWTTNAASVAEVTDITADAASGSPVFVERVAYADNRGPRLFIDLGKEITEKTKYHVTVMGFKGCGSKSIVQTDIEVAPIKVEVSQVGYLNPENKGDISLILKANELFNVYALEYDKANNNYLKVKDDKGNELPVTDIIPTSVDKEGDQLVVNLKGGADSKFFTVEMTTAFLANYMDPTKVYDLTTKTVEVNKVAN